MKTIKASIDTELITSEDGKNTYEVIKKLSVSEGKCGYLISLYPTRTESNIFSNDSTLNHLVSHMTDLGLKELHILSLFSKVVTSKISSRGLVIDEDNMQYLDKVMHSKKFKDGQFIIAWGSSMKSSHAVNEAKERVINMYHNLYPEGLLYQLGVEGKSIADIAPHPLYLGIQAKYLKWHLTNYVDVSDNTIKQ